MTVFILGLIFGIGGMIILKLAGVFVADIYIFDVVIMAIGLVTVLQGFGLGTKAAVLIAIGAGFVMFYLVHICEPVEVIAAFFFSWLWAVDFGSMIDSSSWKWSLVIFIVSLLLHFGAVDSNKECSKTEEELERRDKCQD